MNIDRTRELSASLALLSFVAFGPACVAFISDDANTDTGETDSGNTTPGDGDSGDGDGDSGDGDGDPGECVSIFDIQQGMVAAEQIVCVQGAVVTSPINAETGLAFIQDPSSGEYSGISLYLWDDVVQSTILTPGDVVNLTGRYAEFFDVSQLVIESPGAIEVVGNDTPPAGDVVDAATVARTSASAEPWEGVYVCVNDAAILESNDGFGQYLLVGDALVGNAFVDPLPDVQVGGSFSQVCGPLHFSFDEYKIMPPNAEALAGYTGPEASTTTIPEIQQGMVPENSVVEVQDVIVSSGLTWSNGPDASFFVQDPAGGAFSGIQVFVGDTAGLNIAPGDVVTIQGIYEEFFDMSQIAVADASAVSINGSGPAPTPEIIADPASIATGGAAAEDYESVLVRVENVSVTDENPDAPDEFGEFAVDGNLRVDDAFFAIADWNKPMAGQGYASITGLLIYGYSNFKLEPRDNADLVQN